MGSKGLNIKMNIVKIMEFNFVKNIGVIIVKVIMRIIVKIVMLNIRNIMKILQWLRIMKIKIVGVKLVRIIL